MVKTKINTAEHTGLSGFIAKKYLSTGIEFDELVSVGHIGLIKAANSFDSSKGFKFATYASLCINNEILMFLRKESKRPPCISITQINAEGDEFCISEVFNAFIHRDEYKLEETDDVLALREAITQLDEREQLIIQLRFYENKTQTQVGKVIGVEQSYISRLERRVLNKLKECIMR